VIVSEILRGCISGLLESENLDRVLWIAFTYIKVGGVPATLSLFCWMFTCLYKIFFNLKYFSYV